MHSDNFFDCSSVSEGSLADFSSAVADIYSSDSGNAQSRTKETSSGKLPKGFPALSISNHNDNASKQNCDKTECKLARPTTFSADSITGQEAEVIQNPDNPNQFTFKCGEKAISFERKGGVWAPDCKNPCKSFFDFKAMKVNSDGTISGLFGEWKYTEKGTLSLSENGDLTKTYQSHGRTLKLTLHPDGSEFNMTTSYGDLTFRESPGPHLEGKNNKIEVASTNGSSMCLTYHRNIHTNESWATRDAELELRAPDGTKQTYSLSREQAFLMNNFDLMSAKNLNVVIHNGNLNLIITENNGKMVVYPKKNSRNRLSLP